MNDIVLTGFMGTGKSTVGRLLAERLGLEFVDTDVEIVRRAGRPISAIFEAEGEAAFRRLEGELLRELSGSHGRVIATGGGTLLTETSSRLLVDSPDIVCLACSEGELEQRLAASNGRPLAAGDWKSLLRARQERYAQFRQVDTTGRSPNAVTEEIIRATGGDRLGSVRLQEDRSSDVVFARGALDGGERMLERYPEATGAVIVTDRQVGELGYAERVQEALDSAGLPARIVTLPAGEESKSLETLESLYGACLDAGLDRRGLVVGVGGGVIGDISGMLAATYMRGVPLLLVPTTLLAQVDAAIGGKVGVDARGTKNLVGAFYPARTVVIDPAALGTLPVPRLSEGLAEVIKIGMMRSRALLSRLDALDGPQSITDHPVVVRMAAAEKIAVVANDPFERGERALLNFGHTVGHALEAASGYRVSHGAAVAAGMAAEARVAVALRPSSPDTVDRLCCLLERFHLPERLLDIDLETAYRAMLGDKKREAGRTRLAVPREVGHGTVITVEEDAAREALRLAVEERR